MSDYYLALIDVTADASNAQPRADAIRDVFIAKRIILAETSDSCVYGGVGHLPGPRLNESYEFAEGTPDWPPESRYWNMPAVCGVQFFTEKWVNMFGLTVFEWARCPNCSGTFQNGGTIMNPLWDAVGDFLNRDEPSLLRCPGCHQENRIQSWITRPHLGLCHLAVQFWNWPDFGAKGWQISIPEIASRAIGCPLVSTHGRM